MYFPFQLFTILSLNLGLFLSPLVSAQDLFLDQKLQPNQLLGYWSKLGRLITINKGRVSPVPLGC